MPLTERFPVVLAVIDQQLFASRDGDDRLHYDGRATKTRTANISLRVNPRKISS